MMGVLSDDDFLREVDNCSVEKSTSEVVPSNLPKPGRSKGDLNVPNSLRKIIGETSAIEGRQKAIDLADMFGVSKSSVSAYAVGATSASSYNKPQKSILDHINRHKERITKKAHSKLGLALDALNEDNLKDAKPRDLAGIAKDMSVVIKNMEPENKDKGDANKPVFVFYKPELKTEEYFDTIKVNE